MTEQQAQQPTLESLQNNNNESIRRTAQEIAEIKWTNNEKQKIQLEWILTTEFAKTLNNKTEIAKTLYKELPGYNDNEDKAITELRKFLEPIANPHKVEWNLTKQEIQETEGTKSIFNKFSDYFWEGKTLSNIPEWIDNSITTAIENIKKILENPTKENIKRLQDFLYNNLSDDEKTNFFKANKASNVKKYNSNNPSNNWDWNIWKCEKNNWKFTWSTAKALDDFLKKTADYVNKYKEHIKIAENGTTEQLNKINNANKLINNLNNNPSITTINTAYNYYEQLTEWEKTQIENNLIQKLEEVKKTLNSLNNKMVSISTNITNTLKNNTSTDQQKIYELTNIFKNNITKQEAQILLNEISNNTNSNSNIIISGINITQYTEIFKQALTNITENKIQSQETEAQKQEKTQAQIEQNNNASKSFDEISEDLKKIWNAKINAILTQIAPLNEKLKQWHSISYLETEKTRIENAIKNFWWDDVSFKENWRIESWLDRDEKKWFRKEIRDLEKQLMDVRKELKDKKEIKDKIYKNETNTESWMITEIKKIINTDQNNFYLWALDSYISNLDNIGQDIESPQEASTEKKETAEDNPETDQKDVKQNTPEKGQSSINRPTNTTRISWFQQLFNIIKENLWWFERVKWKWLFGNLFALADARWKNWQINLDQFDNNDIKQIMRTINNESRHFNGRQEIISTINSKSTNQIKRLQEKLITLDSDSNFSINWNIDENTANRLQNYINNQVSKIWQNNYNTMTYSFCEWYTKNLNHTKNNEELYTNENDAILITRNNDWFITKIEKWNLDENLNNISNSNKETRNITEWTVTEATNNENSSASTENWDQWWDTSSSEAQVPATNSTGNQPTASETTKTPQSATQ